MSNTQHTPGPWELTHTYFRETVTIPGEYLNDELVASMSDRIPREEQRANAALIAAAPRLETELERCVELLRTVEHDIERIAAPLVISTIHERVRLAALALAAARGEQAQ